MFRKIKFCIYGLGTYELLSKGPQSFIGGAELQQSIIARELPKYNFDVSVIVYDCGQASHEIIDGIHLYKTVPKGFSINGSKSLFKVLRKTWYALNMSNSDIYYYRSTGIDLGFLALFCLLKKKKLILGLASNQDVNGEYLKNASLSEKISYLFGVKSADSIICQNQEQLQLLKTNFGRDGTQINSMHYIPHNNIFKKDPPVVIWVGTIKPKWKQPELFLKLASAIPDAKFQIIGGPSRNIEYYEHIRKSAEKIPNLEFVGFVPYPKINEYFDEASVLVNTSSVEGFPNTFIQAWMRNVPTVSLNVDPNEIICKHNLGFHSKTFEQMVSDVQTLLNCEDLRFKLGKNAREYSEKQFDSNNIMPEYINVIGQLVSEKLRKKSI